MAMAHVLCLFRFYGVYPSTPDAGLGMEGIGRICGIVVCSVVSHNCAILPKHESYAWF